MRTQKSCIKEYTELLAANASATNSCCQFNFANLFIFFPTAYVSQSIVYHVFLFHSLVIALKIVCTLQFLQTWGEKPA